MFHLKLTSLLPAHLLYSCFYCTLHPHHLLLLLLLLPLLCLLNTLQVTIESTLNLHMANVSWCDTSIHETRDVTTIHYLDHLKRVWPFLMNLKHVCNIHRILRLLFYIVYLSSVVLIGPLAAACPVPLTHDFSFSLSLCLVLNLFTSPAPCTQEERKERQLMAWKEESCYWCVNWMVSREWKKTHTQKRKRVRETQKVDARDRLQLTLATQRWLACVFTRNKRKQV